MATAGHATMLYYARHGRVGLGIGMAYGALLSATSRACMAPVAIEQPVDGHVSSGVVSSVSLQLPRTWRIVFVFI